MGRDWKRWRESAAERSAAASRAARARWDGRHAGMAAEPVWSERCILEMGLARPGLRERLVRIQIVDDGAHRRRIVLEDGKPWGTRLGRTSLLNWFGAYLKGAGV